MMGKKSLAPGVRFHPTDLELVMYYLKRKILGKKLSFKAIAEVDIYKHAPWDLPETSCLKTGDLKWFFYCPIEKKYARGARLNRATVYGYWKTTGKDRPVKYNEEVVGMIKTLVFHRGKAPRGDRTDWVMHEYRLEQKDLTDRGVVEDTFVLCVLFQKDGMGPRNGAQYGAPFKEEDWSDDEDANLPGTGSLSSMSILSVGGASSSCVPESQCAGPSVDSSGLYTLPMVVHTNAPVSVATCVGAPQVPVVADANAVPALLQAPQFAPVPEVEESMLELFTVEDAFTTYNVGEMAGNAADSFYEAPLVEESNGSILSMLELFTEEDAFTTYDRGLMTDNANGSFCLAPQVGDDDDILSMLAYFREDNNLNNVLYPYE